MLSRAEAEALAASMADALVMDVAGAGHLIHWQQPEATARLCLGFLESL
jgi:pimeloyl-ACP methyl ester carboxylesterase